MTKRKERMSSSSSIRSSKHPKPNRSRPRPPSLSLSLPSFQDSQAFLNQQAKIQSSRSLALSLPLDPSARLSDAEILVQIRRIANRYPGGVTTVIYEEEEEKKD